MDKSAFVEAVRFSIICQGPQEESHAPLRWVISRYFGPGSSSLGHNMGASGGHCLRKSPTKTRAFVEVQVSSREVPAHHWLKKQKLDALKRIRGTVWLYLHHLSSRQHRSVLKKIFSVNDFSCRGKWVSECPASPDKQIAVKQADFSPTPCKYWVMSCMTLGCEESETAADETLGRH